MKTKPALKKRWFTVITGIILILSLAWLATSNNPNIWTIRNTLQYHALKWWWQQVGYPELNAPGALRGTVRNTQGRPIAGAWVLITRWNGATYSARTEAGGSYIIRDAPAGNYRPVAGAPGYDSVALGGFWRPVTIAAGQETVADVVLPVATPPVVEAGADLRLGEPAMINCVRPLETAAMRRQVRFDSAGQPNQPTLFYTPITATAASRLPILLAVYPGPADGWECASTPLAAAGYAVLAAGPAYSFEPEQDIDELERLLDFARAGAFPGSDNNRAAILGGSYSSLHVLGLLQRDQNVEAALLLGPPTDLFDMRRRLENGTFRPPFGLDRALIALGLPSHEPLRYLRYSGAYHVHPDFPPLAILHSRTDEVVPFQQSELLAKNLAMVGAAYEAHFFDGASHYLLAEEGDADTLKIYEITLNFLAKHLK